jgi:hypothetical protein
LLAIVVVGVAVSTAFGAVVTAVTMVELVEEVDDVSLGTCVVVGGGACGCFTGDADAFSCSSCGLEGIVVLEEEEEEEEVVGGRVVVVVEVVVVVVG